MDSEQKKFKLNECKGYVFKVEKQFISEKGFSGVIELTRSLNEKIANWTNFEEIRKFYSEVNKSYNPDFVELIQNFE